MSGVAAINARIRPARASNLGARVFRGERGATDPSSRRRCLSRRTQAGLTEYLAATAFAPIPASQSLSTRVRRSIEYGVMAPSPRVPSGVPDPITQR
jgi:hypothetical protein